jgi:hypothetical protein
MLLCLCLLSSVEDCKFVQCAAASFVRTLLDDGHMATETHGTIAVPKNVE